jgi:hypothetical protein
MVNIPRAKFSETANVQGSPAQGVIRGIAAKFSSDRMSFSDRRMG